MLPKRAGEPLPSMGAEKMPKLTNENTVNRVNDLDVTRVLAEVDQHINQSNLQELEFYVRAGNEDAARQLLDDQTIKLNTREGVELLWLAIEEFQEGIAAMLVRHGVDLNVRKFSDERSLLHHMLRSYRILYVDERQKFFWSMLDHGADINARDNVGHSVLRDAIKSDYCSSQFVEKLLDYGAEVVTTNKDERIDDICLACKHRLELLPRLIQHRVLDEEMRNERAVIAIDCLISENYTGAKGAAAIKMIKKILDLGVPVNLSFSERQKRKFSFLDTALWYKNKAAIKLLLEYGADPHTNLLGHTSLYQATAFKGYTHVSRWLIERGVSVHEPNHHGGYPIHGACENESLRNLHLLLNLGADLNSTDRSGRTPFGLLKMRETLKCKEVHHLIIKHFALIIAQGGKINDKDTAKMNQCTWSRHHFEKCSEQLEKMKEEKVYGDISYLSLLSKNMYRKVQLMKNKNFLGKFKNDAKRRAEMFPDYFYMVVHSVEIAEKRLKMLLAEKEELREGFPEDMPDHIIEKIVYYLWFENLKYCQHEYYMTFHANLKYTQADKAKIL